MSLDIYLVHDTITQEHSGILIREEGKTKEISEEEWYEKNPGVPPVKMLQTADLGAHFNITHNLTAMAEEAGIYNIIWRPEESGITHAKDIIEPLTIGLALLKSDPERFKKYNAQNGWGTYEQFVPWLMDYLEACQKYPEASVNVSR